MPVVELVVELLARDRHLLGVDDDDEVAGVDVRRVLRLVLAAQRVGDARRETPEGLALGVHELPLALDLAGFRVPGLHVRRKSGGPGVRRRRSVAKPARKSLAPPWDGWRTYGPPRTACATRPTAIARRRGGQLLEEGQALLDLRAGRPAVGRERSGMRGDDVPEQHVLLEPELGQHAVDDRRRRLRRARSGQLPFGRERQTGDAGAPVAGCLADEDDRSVSRALEVRRQPFSPHGGAAVLVEGVADPGGREPLHGA